jgi:hypothetical protein
MDNSQSPTISSFVIRFVHESPPIPGQAPAYRGTIHHVQTNQEIPFTHWEDAVAFIQRFVVIDSGDVESKEV